MLIPWVLSFVLSAQIHDWTHQQPECSLCQIQKSVGERERTMNELRNNLSSTHTRGPAETRRRGKLGIADEVNSEWPPDDAAGCQVCRTRAVPNTHGCTHTHIKLHAPFYASVLNHRPCEGTSKFLPTDKQLITHPHIKGELAGCSLWDDNMVCKIHWFISFMCELS